MPNRKDENFVAYKFRDLKTYGSSEWLAHEQKKYRQVFDVTETSYVYIELSFFNKMFDEEDWNVNVTFKAFAIKNGDRKELCNLSSEKTISKDTNIVYLREGWGNKKVGIYWKPGEYEWEAYLGDTLISTRKFFVENVGLVTEDHNPFFNVESLKLYEGPNNNTNTEKRVYYKSFDSQLTRYIFVEFAFENLVQDQVWNCELTFKYYNDAHQLKGETVELVKVNPEDKMFTVTSGWGSNEKGSWFQDKYTLEVVFMDNLVSILPFEVIDTFEEGMNEALLPGTNIKLAPKQPALPQTIGEVMQDLESLIGLESIKTRVKEYAEYLRFLKIRTERGFEEGQKINLHTVFAGNPGTGKTTVAKMLGQIYKHMGLLTKGHVHEVDRADLVGEYIGQTAPKVKEAIKQAKGGILFIDEAYSLARSKDDSKDFGREVLEIVIKEMSDGTGDISVIVAGYPTEMRTFMDTNPGLKSRFTQWFEFPDYLPQELDAIAEYSTKKRRVLLSKQGKAYLYDKIVEAYRTRDRFFGNARFVNNMIDQAKVNLGLRVMKEENPHLLTEEVLSTIQVEDIERIFRDKDTKSPDIPIDEKMLDSAMAELNAMVGLKKVKKDIEELTNLVRFYRETGKEVLGKFSLHTVFVGNPGTGKTTVARVLAKIYKALGVLERGHLVECDRQSLVAGFVGQTAIKTATKVDESMGGVLFVDEAYALTQGGGGNDFGREAVETLIKRMEDQKGKFAIVAAGYPDNMKVFVESNPGLKSRFDRVLTFDDYTVGEMVQIFRKAIKKENLTIEKSAEKQLKILFSQLHTTKDKFFGNGRTVINMVKDVMKNQHLRLSSVDPEKRTKEMMRKITISDIKKVSPNKNAFGGSSRVGFRRLSGN